MHGDSHALEHLLVYFVHADAVCKCMSKTHYTVPALNPTIVFSLYYLYYTDLQ